MRRELELILRILSIFRHELLLFHLIDMLCKDRMLSTDTTRGSKLEAEVSHRFGPMTPGNIREWQSKGASCRADDRE